MLTLLNEQHLLILFSLCFLHEAGALSIACLKNMPIYKRTLRWKGGSESFI